MVRLADIASLAAELGAPVLAREVPGKGRVLLASRDLAPGELLFRERATLFAPAAALTAASVPSLRVFGRSFLPRRDLRDVPATALRLAMQLHPERRRVDGGAECERAARGRSGADAAPAPRPPAAVWAAMQAVSPDASGAASALAGEMLRALRRDVAAHGPGVPHVSPGWRHRLTADLHSGATDDELAQWLALRVVVPLNAVGCECHVPLGDARELVQRLRGVVSDADVLAAGLRPEDVFPQLPPDAAPGRGDAAVSGGTAQLRLVSLFMLLSMLSHDCAPSCYFRSSWDPASGCPVVSLAAARAVAAGEELTISYLGDDPVVTPDRRARLRGYGFTCACQRCAAGVDDTVVYACSGCGGRVYGHCHGLTAAARGVERHACVLRCADCALPLPASPSCAERWADRSELARRAEVGDESLEPHAHRVRLLHPTDAVRAACTAQLLEERLEMRDYIAARDAAAEVARAMDAAPWAADSSFRRRFFAWVDAGDAAALAGSPADAGDAYARAVRAVEPFATDTGTPLMAALLPLLRRAAVAPPESPAAARSLRRARATLEDELDDGEY